MIRGVLSTVGNTPLVELTRLFKTADFRLFAKLESCNPGGSIKDRAALTILKAALDTEKFFPARRSSNRVLETWASALLKLAPILACA